MKDIIKEAKGSNADEVLILMLYVAYFVGYIIGYVKRIMKELKEND